MKGAFLSLATTRMATVEKGMESSVRMIAICMVRQIRKMRSLEDEAMRQPSRGFGQTLRVDSC